MTGERAATYREDMTDTDSTTNPDMPVTGDVANGAPRQFRRSANGKVIAGVARGLANRFDIDANVFRVLFVVLALFWGLGVALYLALWVFVPLAEGEEITMRSRLPESHSHRLTVAVLLGVVVALGVLVATISRGGIAAHGGPSLALVWLVFLVALAVVALRTPPRRLTIRRIAAVIVLFSLSALILLVGAVMGFVASTGVALSGGDGAHTWQPTSLRGVQHQYSTQFGSSTLDLQDVRFPSSGYTIHVSTAIGLVRVYVPANAVVSITTHVGLGPVDLQGSPDGTPFSAVPAPGVGAGTPSRAPHLSIDARVGIGRIVIARATN